MMTDAAIAISPAARTAGTFRYEGSLYFALAMFMITGALEILYWGEELTRNVPATFQDALVYTLAVSQLAVTFLFPVARSDVVVDEHGIYRRFLGLWAYRRIRWDNIRRITARPVPFSPARGQTSVRGITFHPAASSFLALLPGGKFGFSDSVGNWQGLIEVMNHYIAKHRIEVVVYGGKKGGERAAQL